MCTDAYREALIRDLSSKAPSPTFDQPEENAAADGVPPSAERIAGPDDLSPAVQHHDDDEAQILLFDR